MNSETKKLVKYIVICGGVLSGLGKGVFASSTALLLKESGCNITSIKIDPYLNVDAGTMSPYEHGEVFVLDDGGEVDLDLGNYERFIGVSLTRDNNITTGKIYDLVIQKERRGDYLGKTVQIIPHVTNEIQDWIERVAQKAFKNTNNEAPNVCVIELGGTIGDIEHMPFIEALRQFQFRVGKENFCCILVSLVPVMGSVGEQKTKPTQQCAQDLRAFGLQPDIIACRSHQPLSKETKSKISLFCHVDPDHVVSVHDVKNIFKVPLLLEEQGLTKFLQTKLNLFPNYKKPNLKAWIEIERKIERQMDMKEEVRIALVGKYTGLTDSYLSVTKSLQHAALAVDKKVVIDWISSEDLEKKNSKEYEEAWNNLKKANAILVPGGFGDRGIEGMILAIEYARVHKIPFLGICLGMQLAVIEYARNVLGWKNANSEEFEPNAEHLIVINMPELDKNQKGASMRLGKRTTIFKDTNCTIAKLYGKPKSIEERHRHRYEVNPKMVEEIEKRKELLFVGQDESRMRQEIIEMKDHPYFVGVQFHPEFKSSPAAPSPPFLGLLLAATNKLNDYLRKFE